MCVTCLPEVNCKFLPKQGRYPQHVRQYRKKSRENLEKMRLKLKLQNCLPSVFPQTGLRKSFPCKSFRQSFTKLRSRNVAAQLPRHRPSLLVILSAFFLAREDLCISSPSHRDLCDIIANCKLQTANCKRSWVSRCLGGELFCSHDSRIRLGPAHRIHPIRKFA